MSVLSAGVDEVQVRIPCHGLCTSGTVLSVKERGLGRYTSPDDNAGDDCQATAPGESKENRRICVVSRALAPKHAP